MLVVYFPVSLHWFSRMCGLVVMIMEVSLVFLNLRSWLSDLVMTYRNLRLVLQNLEDGFINFGISESRWFPVHLEAIKALYLSPDLVLTVAFPMATSLQVIKLYDLSFACGKHFIFTMQVLQKSPNLCELEIIVGEKDKWYDDTKAASRILEDPDSYVINKDLKMLNTVKIESFTGCKLEILLVKTLLSKSPSLEKLVIQELVNMDPAMALDISRELLHFPRASPKAQLVFMKA